MTSPRVTRSRGRSWRWKVTRTFSLRTRYRMTARTARPVVMLPIRMVQRGPQAEPIHPMSGAPRGVPPMKTARYSAMTRPRMAGSTLSWTIAVAVVITVSAVSPTGMSRTANQTYEGASAAPEPAPARPAGGLWRFRRGLGRRRARPFIRLVRGPAHPGRADGAHGYHHGHRDGPAQRRPGHARSGHGAVPGGLHGWHAPWRTAHRVDRLGLGPPLDHSDRQHHHRSGGPCCHSVPRAKRKRPRDLPPP